MGNNFAITLPKSWTNFFKMKKGEKLEVRYNGVLVVLPPRISKSGIKRINKILIGEDE